MLTLFTLINQRVGHVARLISFDLNLLLQVIIFIINILRALKTPSQKLATETRLRPRGSVTLPGKRDTRLRLLFCVYPTHSTSSPQENNFSPGAIASG
jgi:hypothetical protein